MSGYKIGVGASAGIITTQMIHDAEFDVRREASIRAINTEDALIKKALIEMGWTPPEKTLCRRFLKGQASSQIDLLQSQNQSFKTDAQG